MDRMATRDEWRALMTHYGGWEATDRVLRRGVTTAMAELSAHLAVRKTERITRANVT